MTAEPKSIRLSDAERLDWLRLIRSENVGPRTFHALLKSYGGARAALRALPELARRGGGRAVRIASVEDIERELTAADRIGARFVALGEAEYPRLLAQIDSAPPIIALRGNAEIFLRPATAIVGSRNASAAGLAFAERLTRGIGASGYVVVSGLARGIDQRAHLASLKTGAIAVLAGGLAKPYPPEARPLMEKIANEGAVISEMPIEWEPRGRDFPRRNRLVSGLALGVVVVEAARGSGSLITARLAAEQGRAVFAVPGSPLDPRAEGTNDLIRNGATICTRPEDVIGELEPMRERSPRALREDAHVGSSHDPAAFCADESEDEPAPSAGGSDVARSRILALLGPAPTPIDDLARAAEASIRDVRVVLLELDLAGRLEYSGGDRVALIDIAR